MILRKVLVTASALTLALSPMAAFAQPAPAQTQTPAQPARPAAPAPATTAPAAPAAPAPARPTAPAPAATAPAAPAAPVATPARPAAPAAPAAAAPAAPAATPARPAAGQAALININTASLQDLQELPQIGPARAQAIIAARTTRPFASFEDLVQRGTLPSNAEAAIRDKVRFR